MKKINYFLLIIFILFIGINRVFAETCNDNLNIVNKCSDNSCTSIFTGSIINNDTSFNVLENIENLEIDNLNNWVNSELEINIIDKYEGEFIIENFCKDISTSDCKEKTFTLSGMINTSTGFKVDLKEWTVFGEDDYDYYNDGLEYFFRNYNSIISEINGNLVNLELNDIISNLNNYNYEDKYNYKKNNILNENYNHIFKINNVCKTQDCTTTEIKEFNYLNNNSFNYLEGNIVEKEYEDYLLFDFIESSYDKTDLKVGTDLNIKFKFNVNIPNKTCTENLYKYNIKYAYVLEDDDLSEFHDFKGDIKIDNNGKAINSNDNPSFNADLNDSNNGIVYDETKINGNILELSIDENISFLKTGRIKIFLDIEDNFGNKKIKNINEGFPINILSGNPDKNNSYIDIVEFNPDQIYYFNEKEFKTKIYLNDIGDNSYGDIYYGINVTNDNDFIELMNSENIISKIDSDGKKYFDFKFSFKEIKENQKMIFNISFPIIDNDGNKSGEIQNFDLEFEKEVSVFKKVVSHIKNLKCSREIIVEATCRNDVPSGCPDSNNPDGLYTQIFNDENKNRTNFTLIAYDNAGHQFRYDGRMDHIDRSAPVVTFLNKYEDGVKANDGSNFKLTITDPNPDGCRSIAKAQYKAFISLNNESYIDIGANGSFDSIEGETRNIDLSNELKEYFKISGTHKIKIETEDAIGNKSDDQILEFTIFPTDLSSTYSTVSSTNGNKFANYSDKYTYILNLRDKYNNPIHGKQIVSAKQFNDGSTGFYSLTLDEDVLQNADISTYTLGSTALIEENFSDISDNNGDVQFDVKGLTPGKFTEQFNVKIQNWDDNYNLINNSFTIVHIGEIGNINLFKRPLSATLSIDGIENPAINTNYLFYINLVNSGSLNANTIGKLDISDEIIVNKTVGHEWKLFNVIKKDFNAISDIMSFSGTVTTNSGFLEGVEIGNDIVNKIKIEYRLLGKNISYYLDDINSNLKTDCDIETLGLKVIGRLEGEGKSQDVGQEENFSDLSKSLLRGSIRKNAYTLIKNRTHNTIVNNIKYWDGSNGNIDISLDLDEDGNLNYETLIVKDGNVIIGGDLNINNNKLGIIVLKSNYDVLKDYEISGNIYVKNSVKKINAVIYADGTFRSADQNGNMYSDSALNEKLFLNGSLFTRNTIGGSVGQNTLPGGKSIIDEAEYYLANIYDLNNVRKQIVSCDVADNYAFTIKYNSSIQLNPPKGFIIK